MTIKFKKRVKNGKSKQTVPGIFHGSYLLNAKTFSLGQDHPSNTAGENGMIEIDQILTPAHTSFETERDYQMILSDVLSDIL